MGSKVEPKGSHLSADGLDDSLTSRIIDEHHRFLHSKVQGHACGIDQHIVMSGLLSDATMRWEEGVDSLTCSPEVRVPFPNSSTMHRDDGVAWRIMETTCFTSTENVDWRRAASALVLMGPHVLLSLLATRVNILRQLFHNSNSTAVIPALICKKGTPARAPSQARLMKRSVGDGQHNGPVHYNGQVRSFLGPTYLSVYPTIALSAGTKLPMCARNVMRATWTAWHIQSVAKQPNVRLFGLVWSDHERSVGNTRSGAGAVCKAYLLHRRHFPREVRTSDDEDSSCSSRVQAH